MNTLVDRATDTGRSIGAILVDAGRLRLEDAERIMRLQREKGLRFGDAALQLGLLRQADIEFALARQFDYPYLTLGQSKVSESVVAAYAPSTEAVESLRALRSQLMLRGFGGEGQQKLLAVTGVERGEGRSWLAANLAVVFSQLGEHTLLIDADMRHPSQHQLFGLQNRIGLAAMLSGRSGMDAIQRVPDLLDLSVLTAGASPPNPQELLARPQFGELLTQAGEQYDVVIIDTPSLSGYADAQTIAAKAGCALMVARKHVSGLSRLESAVASLTQVCTRVVGSVLNEY